MTPHEFVASLRAMNARAAAMPAAVEARVQREVLASVPPGVSMRVNRSGRGVQVGLSGRGSRRYARRLRPRLERAAREAAGEVVKR